MISSVQLYGLCGENSFPLTLPCLPLICDVLHGIHCANTSRSLQEMYSWKAQIQQLFLSQCVLAGHTQLHKMPSFFCFFFGGGVHAKTPSVTKWTINNHQMSCEKHVTITSLFLFSFHAWMSEQPTVEWSVVMPQQLLHQNKKTSSCLFWKRKKKKKKRNKACFLVVQFEGQVPCTLMECFAITKETNKYA